MQLLEINKETGLVELADKELFLSVPELATLYNHKVPLKGDSDCKKRKWNLHVFTYIAFMENWHNNILMGYDEATRKQKAIINSKLNRLENPLGQGIIFKEIDIIKAARRVYREATETSDVALYIEVHRSISLSAKALKIVNDKLAARLEVLNNTQDEMVDDDFISLLFQNIEHSQKMSKELPVYIKKIHDLKEQIFNNKNVAKSSGGKEIGNRADPR